MEFDKIRFNNNPKNLEIQSDVFRNSHTPLQNLVNEKTSYVINNELNNIKTTNIDASNIFSEILNNITDDYDLNDVVGFEKYNNFFKNNYKKLSQEVNNQDNFISLFDLIPNLVPTYLKEFMNNHWSSRRLKLEFLKQSIATYEKYFKSDDSLITNKISYKSELLCSYNHLINCNKSKKIKSVNNLDICSKFIELLVYCLIDTNIKLKQDKNNTEQILISLSNLFNIWYLSYFIYNICLTSKINDFSANKNFKSFIDSFYDSLKKVKNLNDDSFNSILFKFIKIDISENNKQKHNSTQIIKIEKKYYLLILKQVLKICERDISKLIKSLKNKKYSNNLIVFKNIFPKKETNESKDVNLAIDFKLKQLEHSYYDIEKKVIIYKETNNFLTMYAQDKLEILMKYTLLIQEDIVKLYDYGFYKELNELKLIYHAVIKKINDLLKKNNKQLSVLKSNLKTKKYLYQIIFNYYGMIINNGIISFKPIFFNYNEFSKAIKTNHFKQISLSYIDVFGNDIVINSTKESIIFTFFQVPIKYFFSKNISGVNIIESDNTIKRQSHYVIDEVISSNIFKRNGKVKSIEVFWSKDKLIK